MLYRQPVIHSLVGLLAGGTVIAWILLTAKPTAPTASSNTSNSTPSHSVSAPFHQK